MTAALAASAPKDGSTRLLTVKRSLPLLATLLFACKPAEDGPQPAADAGAEAGVESCLEAPAPSDAPATFAATAPLRRYVSPFIGTGGVGFGIGSAFPGPQAPFGLARPGPDTMSAGGAPSFSHCGGYSYEDTYVYGFSQTRLHGIGIVEAGAIGLLPTRGGMTAEKTSGKGRRVAFAHKDEQASPGYYRVRLASDTEVELTATERVAWHRYRFPAEADATVLLDVGHALPDVKILDGSVSVDPARREIRGFARYAAGYSGRFGGVPVYFVARFSRALERAGVWKAGALAGGETARAGGDVGAWISFNATTSREVTVAVGLSLVSVEGAQRNLDAEAATLDFDAARNAYLRNIEVNKEQAGPFLRLGALDLTFHFSHAIEILIDTPAIGRSHSALQARDVLAKRVEQADAAAPVRLPIFRGAALAEQAFEDDARVCLGR